MSACNGKFDESLENIIVCDLLLFSIFRALVMESYTYHRKDDVASLY